MDLLFLFLTCGATAAMSVVVLCPRPRRAYDGLFGMGVPTDFRTVDNGPEPDGHCVYDR
jgi:hypothetical protein